jgi:hypothetical protein
MNVHSAWDALGGILTIAIVAVILTKSNTGTDITTTGTAFTGILTAAEAG